MAKKVHLKFDKIRPGVCLCDSKGRAGLIVSKKMDETTCQKCIAISRGEFAPRQNGKRRKVESKIRLNADLHDWLIAESNRSGVSKIEIIESALNLYRGV